MMIPIKLNFCLWCLFLPHMGCHWHTHTYTNQLKWRYHRWFIQRVRILYELKNQSVWKTHNKKVSHNSDLLFKMVIINFTEAAALHFAPSCWHLLSNHISLHYLLLHLNAFGNQWTKNNIIYVNCAVNCINKRGLKTFVILCIWILSISLPFSDNSIYTNGKKLKINSFFCDKHVNVKANINGNAWTNGKHWIFTKENFK